MKQRRINATLAIAALALTTLLTLTALPLTSTAVPRLEAKLDTFSCDPVTEIPQAECEALVAFYNSTNGADWSDNSGWMDTYTPCNWYGVTCNAGHVTGLDLRGNQLSGSIPPELGNLTNVQWLLLSMNQLSGSIPPELGNLTNLTRLYLSNNQLSGSIPPELGNLTNVEWLFLSDNQLSGSIPPEMGNCASLQWLSLHYNQLNGSIPAQLGSLTNLWVLLLNNNQLSGSIPPEMGSLTNLYALSLTSNQLSGSIPAQLGSLTNLGEFYLDNNQLSGSIPPELGNLTNLWVLSLTSNQLSGSIPPELGNLINLTRLSLDNNQLSGSIPPELGNLTDLATLHIENNALGGEVPAAIVNLVNLQNTDLGYNKLAASDPAVVAFLNDKDPDWAQTQTVPPTNVHVVSVSSSSVELACTPIAYTGDGGYYEVSYATTPGGPYTLHGTTNNKSTAGYIADSLSPGTTYCFVVRTYTPAHGDQQNNLWSDYSQEVCGTTENPVPMISNLIPDSTTAGGPAFTLTVNGTNFVSDSVVRWNGSDRTTTFTSSTQLGAAITASDIATVGIANVTVFNPAPGGGTSDPETFTITPNGSLPPIASISFIWYPSYPAPAVQGQDTIYFNGSGTDQDEGGAYITAYVWNSSIDGQLSTQEDFTVQASELSAGTHTIYFKVKDDEDEWSQEVTRTLTVQSSQQDVRTLILVNRQKLEALYSASEGTQVMNKLNALAAHTSVKGLVVQVENDAAVAAAYTAWDADPTSTAKANAVTAAIKALVDAQWTSHPDLEYLVIVGDDRAIPFRRVLDQTGYPESNYGSVSCASVTGAALCDDMSLTDDYYADAVPTVPGSSGWDGHDLYIPDLGTGRLIETPAEIIAQIDAFLTDDGVAAGSAVVTGYDFVKDGAQAMCNELDGDGIPTDCTLISESWDASQFKSNVLNARHDIVSINGHANHYIIGTPSGYVYSSDVDVATADHTQAVFYTVGCHSGLNVPPTNLYEPLDTVQALIQHQANYVANTGYGWGYRGAIGLSEQLMLDLTERLVYGQSATVGQALAAAKQEYYLNDGYFDYYDEKIMIESTLYGLPMVRYITPTATATRLLAQGQGQGATAIKEEQVTVLGDGLTVNSISYQFPALTAESTDDGLYYTFGGLAHTGDGEPIQPKYTAGLSFPETKAHGVVFKGGVYTNVISFDPVVAQAINEYVSQAEPSFEAPGWYPALLHRLNRLERGDKLVTLLGQFNAQSQTERVYDELGFDIYYHTSSDDWTAPTITSVSSAANGSATDITVGCTDASGIYKVVIAYTANDSHWHSTDLAWDGGSGMWTGSIPVTTPIEYFVQAIDNAGNVASDDNGGAYYCALFGDFDGNSQVDVDDVMEVAAKWRMTSDDPDWEARFDLNGDGIITVVDIMLVVAHWGETCG